jgi:predicted nucleotidyltransferase
MKDITSNEMDFIVKILKSPETEYNANSIAKELGISSMGALKIARRLVKENILVYNKLGKAKFYKLNFNSGYVKQYLKFLLKREAEQAHPYVKVWIDEIRKVKNTEVAIMFGSILRKNKEARDIDVMLIANKKKFWKLNKEIEEINLVNVKKLHPMYQTEDDIRKNIRNRDKPLLNAIKGIIAFGEDKVIKMLER